MNRWSMFGVLVAGSSLVACGGADGKVEEAKPNQATGMLAVQGHVSSRIAVDRARAIAIAKDGRVFWTYLDANRDFTLKLPVGQSYRVIIANQRPAPEKGQVIIARLVMDTKVGGQSSWFVTKEAGVVDLGSLRPKTTAGTVAPKCSDCSDADDDDDDDSDHSDDNECHEQSPPGGSSADGGAPPSPSSDADDDDDDDADTDVCSSGSASDVTPSKPPGSKCDADDDDDDDSDSDKACQ